jgi:hypothetical protein
MKILSKIIDTICFGIGPFLTAYMIFNFKYSSFNQGNYYYSNESKFCIGMGVALISVGLLKRYWEKTESKP